VTVFETHNGDFALRGGGLGADLITLQDIRQCDAAPPRLGDGGYFYGDLWKVHQRSSFVFGCLCNLDFSILCHQLPHLTLSQYLYDGLSPGTVRFGSKVNALANGNISRPSLIVDGIEEDFAFLVAADGGWSNFRNKYVEPGKQPVYAGYVLFRGLVDTIHVPRFNSWGFHGRGQIVTGGYTVRGPSDEAMANVGLYVAVPSDAAAAEAPGQRFEGRQIVSSSHRQPAWFVPLVQSLFGSDWAGLWSAVASFGKFSPHPVYEYSAHTAVAGRVLLLGDAAHMASPNTGSGARAAFADALSLRSCLVESFTSSGGHDAAAKIDAALQAYNIDTVDRGRQLLQLSHHVSHRYIPGTQELLLIERLAQKAALEAGQLPV
jgi:2-polyprenyl-6-methoxyphenol hydroxylase-like FAD-dependent oxidoreductase